MTIGIDLGDVWSHYCTLNEDGEVVGPGAVSNDTLGGRERRGSPIYLKARIAMGGGNALDLGQRTASGDGPRGDRGERECGSLVGDLAQ